MSHIQHFSELSLQASLFTTIRSYKMSIMDTHKNGSHLSRQQLAIDIQSDRSFNCSSPLLQASCTSHPSMSRLTIPRSSIRSCIPMVSADSTTEHESTKICNVCRPISNNYLRRMDIYNIYRRSRLARYFHDLVYCCNTSMDSGLLSIESQ